MRKLWYTEQLGMRRCQDASDGFHALWVLTFCDDDGCCHHDFDFWFVFHDYLDARWDHHYVIACNTGDGNENYVNIDYNGANIDGKGDDDDDKWDNCDDDDDECDDGDGDSDDDDNCAECEMLSVSRLTGHAGRRRVKRSNGAFSITLMVIMIMETVIMMVGPVGKIGIFLDFGPYWDKVPNLGPSSEHCWWGRGGTQAWSSTWAEPKHRREDRDTRG